MKAKRGSSSVTASGLAMAIRETTGKMKIEYLRDYVIKLFSILAVRELRPDFLERFDRYPDAAPKIQIKDGILDVFGGIWAEAIEVEETEALFGGKRSRKVKVPAFAVGVIVHQRNYPHEPDDYEPVEKAQFRSAWQAAAAIARLYFENEIDHALEDIGNEQYAEECRQYDEGRE